MADLCDVTILYKKIHIYYNNPNVLQKEKLLDYDFMLRTGMITFQSIAIV